MAKKNKKSIHILPGYKSTKNPVKRPLQLTHGPMYHPSVLVPIQSGRGRKLPHKWVLYANTYGTGARCLAMWVGVCVCVLWFHNCQRLAIEHLLSPLTTCTKSHHVAVIIYCTSFRGTFFGRRKKKKKPLENEGVWGLYCTHVQKKF